MKARDGYLDLFLDEIHDYIFFFQTAIHYSFAFELFLSFLLIFK